MTIQSPLAVLIFLLIIIFAFVRLYQRRSQSAAMVNAWMEERGYTILRAERRSMRRGPYGWLASENQLVYYLVVEDTNGQQRTGWARCGGWLRGMRPDQIDVTWE
jgi:hypothetical protein